MNEARGHIAGIQYIEFWSGDNRLGVRMGIGQLESLLAICKNAFPNETGGLLLGHYTAALDCAIITKISGPPEDSKAGRTWFRRGVKGLKAQLSRLWKDGDYYVGEWHAHPSGSPSPSKTDRLQMMRIARTGDFECKEPVLILVGGTPDNNQLRVLVFREGVEEGIELLQSTAPIPDARIDAPPNYASYRTPQN